MISNLSTYNTFWIANLFTFSLLNGTILKYTDFESDVVLSGTRFSSAGPYPLFQGFQQKIGTEVDEAKLQLWALYSNLVESAAVLEDIGQGLFDGADVLIQRVVMPNPNDGSIPRPINFDTSAGAVTIMHGEVSDITEVDRSHAEMDIKSLKYLLNIPFPFRVYQPACGWPLYSVGCGLSKAAFGVNGTLTGSPLQQLFNTTLTKADDYFDQGIITFTSGANTGVSRTVRLYLNASGQTLLYLPLPKAPSAGDGFTAYPGCDKTLSTCQNKFIMPNTWPTSTPVTVGLRIYDGTNTQLCVIGGTTGSSTPSWSTIIGTYTHEGPSSPQAAWLNQGPGNSINHGGFEFIPPAESAF